MPIYKPSELAKYLEDLGIIPKKGLSQHFLLDGNIVRKIVAFADLKPNDVVVEVGPGPGALTEALLETGAKVLAVEKDHILAEALKRLKSKSGKLEIYCDDILTFAIEKMVSRHLTKHQPRAKVIANLPYHLTTPIMTHFIPMHHLFSTLVVMMQEEVAHRFIAKPGTKEYGSLTVFLKFHASPHYGFKVSRNCFFPRPKVESAVVKFDLKQPPRVPDEEKFFELTRTAFGQRRKMLRTSLKNLYDSSLIQETLQKMGKSPKSRPEELSLEEFLTLYEFLLITEPNKKTS